MDVFARSSIGIVGSNPIRGMDVCLHLFLVCVVLCRYSWTSEPKICIILCVGKLADEKF
jgi:hypothetical protein